MFFLPSSIKRCARDARGREEESKNHVKTVPYISTVIIQSFLYIRL